MTQSFKYDGGTLNRVRASQVTIIESADQGAIGSGSVVINDKAGTLEILGQMDFAADQDDCTNPVLGRGFFGDEIRYQRGPDSTGAAREITASIQDLNAMLGFVVFDGTSADEGNRPAETVDDRLAWFETWCATNLPDLYFGSRIGSSTNGLDANNFKDQHPTDVLAGIILAAHGWNFHVRDWGEGNGPELTCRNDNTSTDDTSSLSISNVAGEADFETTFPPLKDFVLTKRSGNVGSRIRYSYAKDTITETRAATASAFNGRRDITASDSSVKDASTAHERGKDELWQHHTEEFVLEGSLLLPPESVNLACQGDRIGVRLQHLQALGNGMTFYDAEDLVYCRILERQVKPMLKPTRLYEAHFRLSPQEPAAPFVGLVQSAFGTSGEGGMTLHLANPVGIGNLLVYVVSDRSVANPIAPNTDVALPRYGAGAWTKYPNTRVSNGVGPTYGDGVALWYKTADSTSQDGYIASTNAVVGIYELAGMDIGSASEVHKLDQASTATMTIGSLGTAGVDSIGIMVGNFEYGSFPLSGTPLGWTPATGWTADRVSPAYFGGAIFWNSPASYIAHALGDGSSLTASGTRSAAQDGTGQWCGIAILIPPACGGR